MNNKRDAAKIDQIVNEKTNKIQRLINNSCLKNQKKFFFFMCFYLLIKYLKKKEEEDKLEQKLYICLFFHTPMSNVKLCQHV